ncbi:MAG TPA: DUF4276 family protein [Herpetosiphonaceae bacterium]|nr:DUF4276 family protein [Herpetosiphonaceae bacterium]
MKFVLFVEGHTERKALPEFLKRWLDARLPQRVGIKVVRFEGWRDYRDEIAKKVKLNLGGKAGADVIAGIGLLDLYGPTIYPHNKTTVTERYEWAKTLFEQDVGHPRFRQHFAVHEMEAWLLAEPKILPGAVSKALPGKCQQPESVNFNEPPAKLLERLYKEKLGKSYKKVIDGANLFADLSPEVAQEKCPYLGQLLQDMLTLAQATKT